MANRSARAALQAQTKLQKLENELQSRLVNAIIVAMREGRGLDRAIQYIRDNLHVYNELEPVSSPETVESRAQAAEFLSAMMDLVAIHFRQRVEVARELVLLADQDG